MIFVISYIPYICFGLLCSCCWDHWLFCLSPSPLCFPRLLVIILYIYCSETAEGGTTTMSTAATVNGTATTVTVVVEDTSVEPPTPPSTPSTSTKDRYPGWQASLSPYQQSDQTMKVVTFFAAKVVTFYLKSIALFTIPSNSVPF